MSDYRFSNNLRPGGIAGAALIAGHGLAEAQIEGAQQAQTTRGQTPIEEAVGQLITAQDFTFELLQSLNRKLEGVIDHNCPVAAAKAAPPDDRGPSRSALYNLVLARVDTAAAINQQLMVLLETITA